MKKYYDIKGNELKSGDIIIMGDVDAGYSKTKHLIVLKDKRLCYSWHPDYVISLDQKILDICKAEKL